MGPEAQYSLPAPISIARQFSVITQPRGSSYVRSWDGMAQGCKSFKSEGCETWTLQGLGATGSWGYGGLGAAVSGGSGKVVAATSGYGGYSEARSCRTWELCSLRLQGCVRSGTFWGLGVSESGAAGAGEESSLQRAA